MKKKRWIAGMFIVLLISGCSVRDAQVKRAEAVLGNFFTENTDREEEAGGEQTEDEEGIAFGEVQSEEGQTKESALEETSTKAPEGNLQEASSEETSAENQGEEASEEAQTEEVPTREESAEQAKEAWKSQPAPIQLGGTEGTSEEISYQTKYVINCQKSITLRKAPSTSAEKLDEILWGEPVSFIKDDVNGFSKVAYLGKTGYVLAAYLGDTAPTIHDRISSGDMEAVRVRFDYFIENERECADIFGLDGKGQQVWKYEARSSHGMTELESVQEIGIFGDAYYLNEDGTIVALGMSDGRVLWKNADFGGASISFTVDGQGTLYLCGYYGPDLCAIDRAGNTLFCIESFAPNLQWPYDVYYLDNAVYVTCTDAGMGEVVVKYNLLTGEISY